MANIIFRNEQMRQTASEIKRLSEEYRNAGETFVKEINSATVEWEGESKRKFIEYIEGSIKKHLCVDIPQTVAAISTLLINNLDAMQKADAELAKQIASK